MTTRVTADHMTALVQFPQLGVRAERRSPDEVGGDEEPTAPAASFELPRNLRDRRGASIVKRDQPRIAGGARRNSFGVVVASGGRTTLPDNASR